jgi:hypothetical protein
MLNNRINCKTMPPVLKPLPMPTILQRDLMNNRMKKKRRNEQRADHRIVTAVAIVCRPYSSTGKMRLAEGVMRNFSSRGAYIEINQEFKIGTILIVRMVGCLPAPSFSDGREKPRSICLVEIKWEQDLTDVEKCLYGMGLRYLD